MAVVAEALDLSRLPAPVLIPISFEEDLVARIARLKEIFDAAEIPYDVEKLLTDPAGCLQEADNYRESLAKVAINETHQRTLIAFAEKASLDWWGVSFLGLFRMVGETDARFRTRLILEFENKSGGRLSGYKAEALKVSIDVVDAGIWVDRAERFEPIVRLAVMATGAGAWMLDAAAPLGTTRLIRQIGTNGTAGDALVAAVQAHMERDDIAQATDVISTQSVNVSERVIDVTLHHFRGPDPAILRLSAAWAIAAMSDERRTPHRALPRSPISASASVGGVERCVVNLPEMDIAAGYGVLIHVTEIVVRSLVTDG